MSGGLGSVVIEEVIFPVVSIKLHGGEFVITAQAHGPLGPWPRGSYVYALFGDDGSLIGRGVWDGDMQQARSLDTVEITVSLNLPDKTIMPVGTWGDTDTP